MGNSQNSNINLENVINKVMGKTKEIPSSCKTQRYGSIILKNEATTVILFLRRSSPCHASNMRSGRGQNWGVPHLSKGGRGAFLFTGMKENK